jgi:hypothetical protein
MLFILAPGAADRSLRYTSRTAFERELPAHIIAIDGTWRRECSILEVSISGARLRLSDSIEGLALKESFLAISKSRTVFRRCELIHVNGEEVGVRFVERKKTASKNRCQIVASLCCLRAERLERKACLAVRPPPLPFASRTGR